MYFHQLLSLLLQEIYKKNENKNKTLNFSHNFSHFLCPNPLQWTTQWNQGHSLSGVESICDEFLKNFILWKHEASAETISQIEIINHSFEQIEQLNTSQNSWISKFILYHLQSLRCFS